MKVDDGGNWKEHQSYSESEKILLHIGEYMKIFSISAILTSINYSPIALLSLQHRHALDYDLMMIALYPF